MKNKKWNKRGIEWEFLFWIIMAVLALIIIVIGIGILSGKGIGAIEFIKSIFRGK
jgi:hypothetical protein